MKAHLHQKKVSVFDKSLGRSIGFEKCVNLCQQYMSLTDDETGLLRAVDSLRDEEQHWCASVSEGLLYIYSRATVTLFDDLLKRCFNDALAKHLPSRVLPVSSQPPREIQLLIDDEYSQIQQLLEPGKRKRSEARARIRTLLAMESHISGEVEVSLKDVDRVEKGIRQQSERSSVFPELRQLQTTTEGEGLGVTVRFSKTEGAPVQYVSPDEDVEAAAIREVDLQKKFHWSAKDLADKVELTPPKCKAVRDYLGIDEDPSCHYIFRFGSQRHSRYSDNALVKIRQALEEVDIDEIWEQHKPRKRRTALRR